MRQIRLQAGRLRWGTSRLAFLLFVVTLPAFAPVVSEAFDASQEVESCEDAEESVVNRDRQRNERRRHGDDRLHSPFAVLAFHQAVPKSPDRGNARGHRLGNGLLAPMRC